MVKAGNLIPLTEIALAVKVIYVTANYSPREDGGLKVINRGYNVKKQRWQESVGKAYFTGEPTRASLKVSFFGPFYGGYNVITL